MVEVVEHLLMRGRLDSTEDNKKPDGLVGISGRCQSVVLVQKTYHLHLFNPWLAVPFSTLPLASDGDCQELSVIDATPSEDFVASMVLRPHMLPVCHNVLDGVLSFSAIKGSFTACNPVSAVVQKT